MLVAETYNSLLTLGKYISTHTQVHTLGMLEGGAFYDFATILIKSMLCSTRQLVSW